VNLTKDFPLDEMIVSQEAARSGLDNTPKQAQLANLKALCENVLQPLRDRVKRPIIVSSGFRSRTINTRIGGSRASQHTLGQAADFTIKGMKNEDVVDLIRAMKLPIDQCILEFGKWVHVSYGPRHRRQFMKAYWENGKVFYKPI
jgi:zinc D-Ala-D-Ala carboxypeptidase